MVDLPAGEMRPADLPLRTLAIRGQHERTLARADQYPNAAHHDSLPRATPVIFRRPAGRELTGRATAVLARPVRDGAPRTRCRSPGSARRRWPLAHPVRWWHPDRRTGTARSGKSAPGTGRPSRAGSAHPGAALPRPASRPDSPATAGPRRPTDPGAGAASRARHSGPGDPSRPKHHRAVGSSNRSLAHSISTRVPPGSSAARTRSSTTPTRLTWCMRGDRDDRADRPRRLVLLELHLVVGVPGRRLGVNAGRVVTVRDQPGHQPAGRPAPHLQYGGGRRRELRAGEGPGRRQPFRMRLHPRHPRYPAPGPHRPPGARISRARPARPRLAGPPARAGPRRPRSPAPAGPSRPRAPRPARRRGRR